MSSIQYSGTSNDSHFTSKQVVNIFPKYDIFAPPPFPKNDMGTVKISSFFHLFLLIFALFLDKLVYFFLSQPITHTLATIPGRGAK